MLHLLARLCQPHSAGSGICMMTGMMLTPDQSMFFAAFVIACPQGPRFPLPALFQDVHSPIGYCTTHRIGRLPQHLPSPSHRRCPFACADDIGVTETARRPRFQSHDDGDYIMGNRARVQWSHVRMLPVSSQIPCSRVPQRPPQFSSA
jgi:hypothetical protein